MQNNTFLINPKYLGYKDLLYLHDIEYMAEKLEEAGYHKKDLETINAILNDDKSIECWEEIINNNSNNNNINFTEYMCYEIVKNNEIYLSCLLPIIQNMSNRLEIYNIALTKLGDNIKFIIPYFDKLLPDEISILFSTAISNYPDVIQYIKAEYKNKYLIHENLYLILEFAIKKKGILIIYIYENDLISVLSDIQIKNLEEFAIKQDKDVISNIRNPSEELCLLAVSSGVKLNKIKNQTVKMCLIAIYNDVNNFKHITRQTKELCIHAINLDPSIIKYLKIDQLIDQLMDTTFESLLSLYLLAIRKDPNLITFVSDKLPLEFRMKIYLEAVKQEGLLLKIINTIVEKEVLSHESYALMQSICTEAVKSDSNASLYVDAEYRRAFQSKLQCPICYMLCIEETKTICNHIFCKACLNTWLLIQNICPMCRHDFDQS